MIIHLRADEESKAQASARVGGGACGQKSLEMLVQAVNHQPEAIQRALLVSNDRPPK